MYPAPCRAQIHLPGASLTDPPAPLDRYGGWTGKRFGANRFLSGRERRPLVAGEPGGNAFLSFGINHLQPEFWNQAYNRAAWRTLLGISDLDGPEFAGALRAWFLRTCREYGFNTVGVHADLAVANRPRPAMAYMLPIQFVDIPHWKTMSRTRASSTYSPAISSAAATPWRPPWPARPARTPTCWVMR